MRMSFLSIITGLLIHEHYTRECEFGNFDKIKNKNKTTQKKHKNFWLNFCLNNKECPKLLCGLGFATEGGRLFQCGIVRGKKEFFRASLYVWCLRY